jgi:hypothetical protein
MSEAAGKTVNPLAQSWIPRRAFVNDSDFERLLSLCGQNAVNVVS